MYELLFDSLGRLEFIFKTKLGYESEDQMGTIDEKNLR